MHRFAALRATVASSLVLLLGACASPVDLVNAVTPTRGYSAETDIPFAGNPRLRLDLYRPSEPAPGAPTVVFFYGGGWESGSRGDYRFVAQALASRGFPVVIPDYRLYPEVRYPTFLDDGAAAVGWVRRHGTEHGVPSGPVALVGHSAGAYIATMLAVDDRWLGGQGLSPATDLSAVVGLAGPYDFLPLRSATLMEIFGPEDQRPQTQPINHVTGRNPPLLLITGTGDTTVQPRNSLNLAAKVTERGGKARTLLYDGVGHVPLVGAFALPLRWLAPVLDDVDGFLKAPG